MKFQNDISLNSFLVSSSTEEKPIMNAVLDLDFCGEMNMIFMGCCMPVDVEDDVDAPCKPMSSVIGTEKRDPDNTTYMVGAASAVVGCVITTVSNVATSFLSMMERGWGKKSHVFHHNNADKGNETGYQQGRYCSHRVASKEDADGAVVSTKPNDSGDATELSLPVVKNMTNTDERKSTVNDNLMKVVESTGSVNDSVRTCVSTANSSTMMNVDNIQTPDLAISELELFFTKEANRSFSAEADGNNGLIAENYNGLPSSVRTARSTNATTGCSLSAPVINGNGDFHYESVAGYTGVQEINNNDGSVVDAGYRATQHFGNLHTMHDDNIWQTANKDLMEYPQNTSMGSNAVEQENSLMGTSDDEDEVDDLLNNSRDLYEAAVNRCGKWQKPVCGHTAYSYSGIRPLWETAPPVDEEPQYLALPTVVFRPVPPSLAPLSMRVDCPGVEFEDLDE